MNYQYSKQVRIKKKIAGLGIPKHDYICEFICTVNSLVIILRYLLLPLKDYQIYTYPNIPFGISSETNTSDT